MTNKEEREIAENSKRDLEKSGIYKDPIVTEIVPFKKFYPADDYHKRYYERNQNVSYCRFVISNPRFENCSINMERT